ncbi:50S ribosome-binding GTPase [Moritella sp. 36]|uniref:GTPase family protein n=1 Tax=Moritella sp. 36 TaxID=2746233 RepID=UPI001BA828AE|nr:GTPase [Moritella sp. 36]QUM88804.1 50S ribosome-binding GTPase [Moritella sp. 36]
MKRVKNSIAQLNNLSAGVTTVLTLAVFLPILVLCGFGLYAIIQYGYTLQFAIVLVATFLISYIPLLLLRRKTQVKVAELLMSEDRLSEGRNPEGSLVKSSADWSDAENAIWQRLNQKIEAQLAENDEWGSLKTHGLVIANTTAQAFSRADFQFSVTDGLKLLEEVSRRYRVILKENVPFVEDIKVSHLKFAYDHQDQIETGKQAADLLSKAYRVYQFINPTAAIAKEVRNKLLGDMAGNVGANLQLNIKKAFLQEVAAVSIDLYSGRFSIEESDMNKSTIAEEDENRQPEQLEPLRIVVIGQISAGKSSLINTIKGTLDAEVSALPSTSEVHVYSCVVGDIEVLNLVDLPGLDGSEKTSKTVLKHVTNADMVLWVLKANQSSRQLDRQFMLRLDEFYAHKDNLHRKRPVFTGILNQVDKLKPLAEWSPPYDLAQSDSAKVVTINKAIDYNQKLLNFDTIIPTSFSTESKTWGQESLAQLIANNVDESINVQRNRQRLEGRNNGASEQLKRVFKGGKSLFKTLFK